MSPICFEIPVFGGNAALGAVAAGASRIELNAADSYPAGGLTPSLQDLQVITAAALSVPLRIMIRPRGPPSSSALGGRDFIYSDPEFEQMKNEIAKLMQSGLLDVERGDGFVFGILAEDTSRGGCVVDTRRCSILVEASRPFKTVFHRAFDEVVSCGALTDGDEGRQPWKVALDDLARCGFDGVLTSGGLGTAPHNADVLVNILDEASKLNIEIIVGGGVRSRNLPQLVRALRLSERSQRISVHSSCLPPGETEKVDSVEVGAILKYLK